MAMVQVVSYNFSIVENPLSDGGNFTTIADVDFPGALKTIAGNRCEPAASNSISGSFWSAAVTAPSNTWPADQYAEITLTTFGSGDTAYLILRQGAFNSGTQYLLALTSPTSMIIYGVVSGTAHILVNNGSQTCSQGDVWRFRVEGNVLTPTRNGTDLTPFTDTNNYVTAGAPGLGLTTTGAINTVQTALWAAGANQCATPTFSPVAGYYATTQTVTITGTASSTIYYTTDGSIPTESSSSIASGATISVSATHRIRAISSKSNFMDSIVATADYSIGTVQTALDTNAWFYPEGGWATSIGITSAQIDVNTAGNSMLQLHAVWNPGPTYPGGPGQSPQNWNLAGGMVMWKSLSMLYGTVEGRIKFTGTGTHPTFWLFDEKTRETNYQQSPNNTSGIGVQEIDIAEGCLQVDGALTDLRQTAGLTGSLTVDHTTVTDYSANFHVYKCVWTPTAVTFFVDGAQTNQITSSVPNSPLYLVMDIECGDTCAGAVVQGNFPQVYQVDYVKAWDSNNNLIFYDEFNGTAALQVNNTSNLVFIQGANQAVASGTTKTLAYTHDTTGKSLLVAQGFAATASAVTLTLTDTLTNNWVQIGTNVVANGNTTAYFYCAQNIPPGGANTVTLHSTVSASLALTIGEYAGQSYVSPLDAFKSASWNSTAASISALTASGLSNEYLITLGQTNDDSIITGASGNIQVNGNGSSIGGVIVDQAQVNSPGSPITSMTWTNGASGGAGMLMAFKSSSTLSAVATPTFSPVAGSYAGAQSVTVSSTDSALTGFAMYYTTDGSTPTILSTLYTTSISVFSSETIKVLAVATGYSNSAVASAAYTITAGPAIAGGISFGIGNAIVQRIAKGVNN